MYIKKKRGFYKKYFLLDNSKGLSSIVVTLLLIVLSLVAIGAVWVVVSSIISSTSGDINITGFTLSLKITRVATQGENLSVTVQRNPGKGDFSKIKFVVSDGVNSEVIVRNASIEELASQTFIFPLTLMSVTNVKTVSIAPVFASSDGTSTTGQITDTFTSSGIGAGGEYSGSNNGTNGEGSTTCSPSCTGTDICTNGVCVPVNCVSESATTTCGTWVCGQRVNNCGENVLCGSCSGSSTCSSGVCTSPSCIPDCTNLECGLDLVCGQLCGVCTGTDTCTNGICVPYNCVPDSNATTCGNWTCGQKVNNCGTTVVCGGNCSAGNLCISGTCTAVTPLNTGLVEETWPGTSALYFGSSNLSTSVTYEGDYAKFPGSLETRCLLIVVSRLPIQGYSKSHIGFNFETSIQAGNHYQIWKTSQECNA
jgi:hypothetical protein